MKIYLASDHAGVELKQFLIGTLTEAGHEPVDMGASTIVPDDDYPDLIIPCARKVVKDGALGIVIGGSGQGEAIAANRIKGARAIVWYGGTLDVVRLGREHNNANILSLGARLISETEADAAATLFINTSFSREERHMRRIAKLDSQ